LKKMGFFNSHACSRQLVNCAVGICVGPFELYLSFWESGVSYSVTTVTLAAAFAAGLSSLVATT
jgi:hypothetical protein